MSAIEKGVAIHDKIEEELRAKHEEVGARALGLRLLESDETRRPDDIEGHEGRVYRRIRFADKLQHRRYLDEGEKLLWGDWYRPSPLVHGRDGRRPLRWAGGHKVAAGNETRFLRALRVEGQASIPPPRTNIDPNRIHREAMIELGVDQEVDMPTETKTPYEPKIQVQDIVADDV